MEALIPASLLAWGQAHQGLLVALGAGSIAMFIGTLVAVPIVICRLPHDIYVRRRAPRTRPMGLGAVLALVPATCSESRSSPPASSCWSCPARDS